MSKKGAKKIMDNKDNKEFLTEEAKAAAEDYALSEEELNQASGGFITNRVGSLYNNRSNNAFNNAANNKANNKA